MFIYGDNYRGRCWSQETGDRDWIPAVPCNMGARVSVRDSGTLVRLYGIVNFKRATRILPGEIRSLHMWLMSGSKRLIQAHRTTKASNEAVHGMDLGPSSSIGYLLKPERRECSLQRSITFRWHHATGQAIFGEPQLQPFGGRGMFWKLSTLCGTTFEVFPGAR